MSELDEHHDTGESEQSSQPQLVKVCIHCFKAKVRCVRRKGGPVCDRCHRLNKECLFRESRRKHKTTDQDVRIEALEAQVEQLMAAFGSFRNRTPMPNVSRLSPKVDSTHLAPNYLLTHQSPTVRGVSESTPVISVVTTVPSEDEDYGEIKDVFSAGYLTLDQAVILLDRFRSTMTAHFPFVVIPPETTVVELRKDKPFLLLAILAASSYEDMPTQRLLGDEVKRAIGDRMILNGETRLEILQGLLVFLAWYQYFSKTGKPVQYSQFLELAIGIVLATKLDKPHADSDWHTGIKTNLNNAQFSEFHGYDGKRALAGCYYLSSTNSLGLRKTATMQHTVYLERCCQFLLENQEYPTDRYLIFIVQLQCIYEKINLCFQHETTSSASNEFATEMYVTSLKSELESFRDQLPFAMEESQLLLMEFHTIELYLHQISLLPLIQSHPMHLTSSFNLTPRHLTALYSGITTSKALLNFCLSLHPRSELVFNFMEWTQISFAIMVSAKLSIIASKGAGLDDCLHLIHTLGVAELLRDFTQRINSLISPSVDAKGDRDVFFYYKQHVAIIQSWYVSESLVAKQPLGIYGQASSHLAIDGKGHSRIRATGNGSEGYPQTPDSISSKQRALYVPEYASSYQGLDLGMLTGFPYSSMDGDFLTDWIPSTMNEDDDQSGGA